MSASASARTQSSRAWSRVLSVGARARELFPITLRGFGVLGTMGAALWFYGLGALDGVWYVAGIGLLLLCGIALVSVLLAALRMRWALHRAPVAALELVRCETSRVTETRFTVPRLRFWLFVDISVEWLEPPGAEVTELPRGALLGEQVRLADHGLLRQVTRRVIVRDVFGLCSVVLRRREPLEMDVLPHAGGLRSLPLLRSLAGGDDVPHPMGVAQGDRLELRRYGPGDPARFIHWKAYARTRKLVVRMPERALSRAHRVAAYLVAAPGDGPSAAAARVALEEGAFGDDFRFGADGANVPVQRVDAALVAIMRSSLARGQSASGLRAFVDEVEREGPTSLVLFVPPQLGDVAGRVRDVVKQRARPVRVVIGIDGLEPTSGTPLWSRVAFVGKSSPRVSVDALRETISAYRRFGCDVSVLDRESGRVLGEAHFAHVAQRSQVQSGEAA